MVFQVTKSHLSYAVRPGKLMTPMCRPGPAHLDTCEFYISSKNDPDFLLKYVGFIDRGQRIESRYVILDC